MKFITKGLRQRQATIGALAALLASVVTQLVMVMWGWLIRILEPTSPIKNLIWSTIQQGAVDTWKEAYKLQNFFYIEYQSGIKECPI